jgi:hypothetical protein
VKKDALGNKGPSLFPSFAILVDCIGRSFLSLDEIVPVVSSQKQAGNKNFRSWIHWILMRMTLAYPIRMCTDEREKRGERTRTLISEYIARRIVH